MDNGLYIGRFGTKKILMVCFIQHSNKTVLKPPFTLSFPMFISASKALVLGPSIHSRLLNANSEPYKSVHAAKRLHVVFVNKNSLL